MSRKRTPGLRWLDREDNDQIIWAENYLQERWRQLEPYSRHLGHEYYNYDRLLQIGDDLEHAVRAGGAISDSLKKFLQDMKAAARGAKARKKKRESGTRYVAISSEADQKLATLAAQQGISESSVLERLIERSFKAKARASKQSKTELSNTPSPFERPSLADMKEFFQGDELSTNQMEQGSMHPTPSVRDKETVDQNKVAEITPPRSTETGTVEVRHHEDSIDDSPPLGQNFVNTGKAGECSNPCMTAETNDTHRAETAPPTKSSIIESRAIRAMKDKKRTRGKSGFS
jgi:hypothetical protein